VLSSYSRPRSASRQSRVRLAAFVAATLVLSFCDAPIPQSARAAADPVRAEIAAGELRPGTTTQVTVSVHIDEGWHINSPKPRQKFLIPTRVEWKLPAGVTAGEVGFPEPHIRKLPFAGDEDLALFEGDIRLTATLAAAADADLSGTAAALVHFQACNENVCLRPKTIELPLGWTGPAAGVGGFLSGNGDAGGIAAGGMWVVVPAILGLVLGLGMPYLVLAAAAGPISSLPWSGAWLQWTGHLFGCVLLAMALYFVGWLLPDNIEHWLMAGYLAGAAVFLAFIDKAGAEFRAFVLGRKMAGVATLAAVGFIYLPVGDASAQLPWQEFSAATYDTARKSGSPFVIEFGAEWCLPCKEMAERTFRDAAVLEAGKGMTFISVDMTTSDRHTELILQSFEVFGAPTTIFYGTNGKEWKRKIGFVGPDDFAEMLTKGWKQPGQKALGEASGA
jgi:thiol-disulfide isomerase/thioredoxin